MSSSPSIANAMGAMFAAEDRVDTEERLTDRTARLLAEALADGLDSGLVTTRLNQYREDRAGLEASRAEAARLRLEYMAAVAAQTKK